MKLIQLTQLIVIYISSVNTEKFLRICLVVLKNRQIYHFYVAKIDHSQYNLC